MDAVDEVKNRLNIEDIIGEYVQLKRSGRNFKGSSPFNDEKTPSFVVSPEKQIWHDFSSGKGGNVFSFVMEMEGLDFRATLELLARKAGVDLEQYGNRTAGNTKLKERLYQALEMASKFYQVQFSKNKTALDYVLKDRKFSKETALKFRLGYSPNNGSALIDFLLRNKFTNEEIQKSGLSVRRYNGANDMFRGRLMIPLQDAQGRVIGFTARQLDDDKNSPKYINTPQTLLYDKSRHVYGLHLAKDSIRKQNFAVLVEGNLDVISSHQADVTNVVATAGTALTEPHLKTISRFSGDVRLAFDSDKAGLAATERAIPIASRVKVSLSIITISSGKDPDDLIKKDPKLWEKAIADKQYALDWLIKRYQNKLDLGTGQGKRQFSDILIPTIRGLQDAVEQDHYLQVISKLTGIRVEALDTKLSLDEVPKRLKINQSKRSVQTDQMQLEWAKTQDHLLSLALMRPYLRDQLEMIDPEMMPQETARTLLTFLQSNPEFEGELAKAPLLHDIVDYVKIVALQYEALFIDLDEHEARYTANRLRIRLIDMFVKTKKSQIGEAMKDADEEMNNKLLERAKTLDRLLNTSQETF